MHRYNSRFDPTKERISGQKLIKKKIPRIKQKEREGKYRTVDTRFRVHSENSKIEVFETSDIEERENAGRRNI